MINNIPNKSSHPSRRVQYLDIFICERFSKMAMQQTVQNTTGCQRVIVADGGKQSTLPELEEFKNLLKIKKRLAPL
jgi:hypothetical protein